MIAYFKSAQTSVLFVLLFFFIVLKVPFLLLGNLEEVAIIDNLWSSLGLFFTTSFFINFILAQCCIFIQAIWFNFLFNKADYHENNGYIAAFYFILLTMLIPAFNQFGIYTILVFILLLLFQIILSINANEDSRKESFNLGILISILILLNKYFIFFLPFLFLIHYSIKSFRITDSLLLLFGILFPFYITISCSYIFNISLDISAYALYPIHFFSFNNTIYNSINLIATGLLLLFAFISMRGILFSVSFKRRKNIIMLIFFLIGTVITILFSATLDESMLSILFIPISIFLALFMLRIRKQRFGEILNAIFILLIFIVNICRLF